ncbi:MAG: aminotransferase class I/II-fold pyridoxal phosphate-dependent enzyme [Clostridiaceae bacterium]|nr:aminotransferase class I/II-fold pyridoxal phosphate-dependent enzyme [Clostridiaceae bacterium]
MGKKLKFNSLVVHGASGYDERTGAVSIPIYQSATFRHRALYDSTGYDYSRLQNPTREELENTIARMDCAKYGFAFSSGMAAITTAAKLFKSGDHIIISDDLYGGTYRLFEEIYKNYGIQTTYVDITNLDEIKGAIRENSKAILYETPTNPMLKVADISKISEIARENNLISIVDNTLYTPYLQKPLTMGADICVYSATKFLAGHNDTLAGLITTNDDEIAHNLKLIQKSEGAVLSPFDSWLVLRGIKTLAIRMERAEKNAKAIYKFLKNHKNVTDVFYSGKGAILSFRVKNVELVHKVLKDVKLIYFAESLGGCETLITYPTVQTHNAIPEDLRNKIGVNDLLLRLSVGIEDKADLIYDLDRALTT